MLLFERGFDLDAYWIAWIVKHRREPVPADNHNDCDREIDGRLPDRHDPRPGAQDPERSSADREFAPPKRRRQIEADEDACRRANIPDLGISNVRVRASANQRSADCRRAGASASAAGRASPPRPLVGGSLTASQTAVLPAFLDDAFISRICRSRHTAPNAVRLRCRKLPRRRPPSCRSVRSMLRLRRDRISGFL